MMPAHRLLVALCVLTLFVGAGVATPAGGTGEEPAADAGPPGELPGPVPDFVSDLLDAISGFLGGLLDGGPGSQVSEDAGSGR